ADALPDAGNECRNRMIRQKRQRWRRSQKNPLSETTRLPTCPENGKLCCGAAISKGRSNGFDFWLQIQGSGA
ncbi:hypothetical protein, partial [Mesorhizobium sp.]|uniref:hypothetical protein n=1 Tax=Mesorhizobium sp. TaxID=1871066 RepID=UPI0025BFE2AF